MRAEDLAQRALATRIAESTTTAERQALLEWAESLLAITRSNDSALSKTRQAFAATLTRDVAWPASRLVAAEIRRLGWDDRGLKSKWAIGAAGTAMVAFGTQGAGIAALGGAIGVPLWLVFGAGGAFLGMLYEELRAPPKTASAHVPKAPARQVADAVVIKQADARTSSTTPAEEELLPGRTESRGKLKAGDVITCVRCGNERAVSKAWLDALSAKRGDGSADPSLVGAILAKLKCSVCGSRSVTLQAEPQSTTHTGRE